MEVNKELVDKLANLSKLSFNDAEKERIQGDLQNMIGFIEKLQEVDTEGVEPLLHISPNVNVLRADVAETNISHEEALKNAPGANEDFFRVPKVINK